MPARLSLDFSMLRLFPTIITTACLLATASPYAIAAPVVAPAPVPAPATPADTNFPTAPHDNVLIEWWYLNSHVTTTSGRHLALIASFFRLGNGLSLTDGVTPQARSHYLIYGFTDLDKQIHQSFSYCDSNMMDTMRQMVPAMLAQNPKDLNAIQMMTDLDEGRLPSPHKLLNGPATETSSPLALQYGKNDTLVQANNSDSDYLLTFGDEPNIHLSLNFHANSPVMKVGGTGETGLAKPTDMYYYSLTNCAVTGSVNTARGSDPITQGTGWFDHQWGNSWGASNDGWDWWGIQLDNGEQVLLYRQRDLSTGKVFSPSATFMDGQGNQTQTTNIVFTPDKGAVWTDPNSRLSYPLGWTLSFPDKKLSLHIQTPVQNQTIPTLGMGGAIWEGHVEATGTEQGSPVTGQGFMELVGYDSIATRRWVNSISK